MAEALCELVRRYPREQALTVAENATLNLIGWSTAGTASAWREGIGGRTRQLWNTFSDDRKIALAEDAHDLLLAGTN
jgi:hypothetical protein